MGMISLRVESPWFDPYGQDWPAPETQQFSTSTELKFSQIVESDAVSGLFVAA